MTYFFDSNSQDIANSTLDDATSAPMIYDAFYVNSAVFQNYISTHDMAHEPHIMPETWAIVKSHAGKSSLKKIHGIQKADQSNHLVIKDLPKNPNPFFERVKEIDPKAEMVILGSFNLATDILGFTEQAVNPKASEAYPVLSEEEAYKLFKRREYQRNSFGYQNTSKPALR